MTYKLLLVDDNHEVRNLIRLTLSFGIYELKETNNGVDALRIINEWQPDLVLLDIMMPGEKDGLQVCREVKKDLALKNTLIVILSARGQKQDIQEGKDAGADAYLIKPFSPHELRSLITHYATSAKTTTTATSK